MAANLEKLVEDLSKLSVLEAAELVKAPKRRWAFPPPLLLPWLPLALPPVSQRRSR